MTRTVANGKGIWPFSPVAAERVDIARADTAAFDLDFNVLIVERFGIELLLVKIVPGFGAVGLEAGELLRVRHFDGFGDRGAPWEQN